MNYRKPIINKIITDLEALTHDGGTNKLFASVDKIDITYPTTFPSATLLSTSTSIDIIGNTTDERNLMFNLTVFELIENSASQSEAELKIDRAGNIEDVVVSYLEKIPNNMEHAITNCHIADIKIDNVNYIYSADDRGIELLLSINFTLKIVITPQIL